MLQSLTIRNFRSCDQAIVRLGVPVVALVGKNGVGKTNIVQAIQLAAELCTGEPRSFPVHARDRGQPASFGLEFVLAGVIYEYAVSRMAGPGREEVVSESLSKDGTMLFERTGEHVQAPQAGLPAGLRIGSGSSTMPALLQIMPDSAALTLELAPIASYLRAVQYYPLHQGFIEHGSGPPPRPASDDGSPPLIEAARYESWKAGLAQGRPLRSVQLRLVHLWLTDRARFDELCTLMGDDGLGLLSEIRIEEVRPSNGAGHGGGTFDTAYAVSFVPGTGLAGAGRPFRYSGLSAGTLRVLQLMTYLIFDEDSCILLEQPEDSIHAGLLAKVIDVLRTYSGRMQFVCTTHSPRVMNLVGADGIRFVSAEDGQTHVSELSPGELEAAGHYIADEGTLAEYLETR